MASGFARLKRLFMSLLKGEQERLESLVQRDKTIELKIINSSTKPKIIEIDLGFGREFWLLLSENWTVTDDATSILEGKLIVVNGYKLKTPEPLRQKGFEVEKIFIRF
jgi:hypothetical protein